MKRFSRTALTVLLSAFVVLGLSACAEQQTTVGSDTTGTATDTALAGQADGMQQGGMQQDSVTVQGTISLLRQGVQSIAVNQAVQNINGWQTRLEQQSGNQTLSQINDHLDQLKSELQATQIDGQAVGDLLSQLGKQTFQAAQNASGQNVQQLKQLGKVLSQTGSQLTGGGS